MIYVSVLHAQGDEALAERVATALARRGCEARPVSGDVLEGDLAVDGAPALVIWTRRSVRAPGILRCARAAMARGALIPVKVAGAAPPADFAALAPADLTGWTGGDHDPRWRFVMEEVALIAARGRLSDGNMWAQPAAAESEISEYAATEPEATGREATGLAFAAPEPALRETFDRREPVAPADEAAFDPAPGFDFTPPPSSHAPQGGGFGVRHVAFVAAGVLVGATGLAAFTAPMIFAAKDRPQAVAASPEALSGIPPPASLLALTIDIPQTDEAPAGDPVPAEADAPPAEPELKSPPPLRDAEPIAVAAPPAVSENNPETDETAGRALVVTLPPRLKPAGQAPAAADAGGSSFADNASADGPPADDAVGDYLRDCVVCPDMAVVPAGRFLMGSPATEQARHEAEGPVAMVDIAGGFAMAAREITMAQWDACVAGGGCRAYTPPAHGWGRGEQPVVSVSFEDAQSYAEWLSYETGRSYRLPSEAEWEYAARAGTSGPFFFGFRLTPEDANYNARYTYGGPAGTAAARAVKTASFAPNPFGLYDMHGNVWEWTADCWAESHQDTDVNGAPRNRDNGGDCARRVLKGGAWNTGGWRLRAAHRIGKAAGVREYDNGFRVVRELD